MIYNEGIMGLDSQGNVEGGEDQQYPPINGYDKEGNLWVFGKKANVLNRKPRPTKAGSLSNVHRRRVTGDLRDEGGGVGGTINTNHQGINGKSIVENDLIRKGI